jgi:hypothetical protein
LLFVRFNPGQILLLSILAVFLILLSLNVGSIQALKLTAAIVIQVIPGCYLWNKINKDRVMSLSELIGMGLAIGTLLSIVSSTLLRTVLFGSFGWAIPFCLTLIAWFFERILSEATDNSVKSDFSIPQVRGLLIAISILMYTQINVWSRWNSLNPKGWWKYHLDVPYFEALSNSLAIFGTSNSLMKPDLETRYHWFAYGWVGALNKSLDVEPLIVQTRLLPLVAMIMAASIAFSWVKDFTDNPWMPATASLLMVVGPGFAIGSLVMLRSPSSAMAAGWTLAFSLHLFRCLEASKAEIGPALLLCLLSIGVVAGKGINVLIIGSGILVLLIGHLLSKKSVRFREIQVYSLVLVSLVVSYFYFIHTPDGRSLKFGIYLGWPALVLTVLPLMLGTFTRVLWNNEQHRRLRLYAFGSFFSGAFLSLVTTESAGGQLYFIISALTLCIVPSLILLEQTFHIEKIETSSFLGGQAIPKYRKLFLIFFLISGLLASGTWVYFENRLSLIGDLGRALAPTFVWVFAIIGTGFFIFKVNLRLQNFKLVFTALVLAISVTSSSVGILASAVRGPIYADNAGYVGYGKSLASEIGSVSSNYFKAGEWVEKNTDPEERFFTNRQCLDHNSKYEDCLDVWFFASALSARQYLIEGGAYNINDDEYITKMNKDQSVSLRFSIDPNLVDLEYLWSNGVRWGWIDKKVVNRKDWYSFARTVYSNEDIAIIQLINPSTFQVATK